jgi:hypothetical protein
MALADFVGLILANWNMIQSPQDFRTGNTDPNGNGTWATANASIGTGLVGPDGLTTAQSLVENSATSEHTVTTPGSGISAYVFCGSTSNVSGYPFRFTLIGKPGSRTRLVVKYTDTFSGLNTSLGFDLAGLNSNYADVTTGTTISNRTMTNIAGGFVKTTWDLQFTNAGQTDFTITIKLDNGSGTGALSTNYAGNGSGNVLLWFFGMLPVAAQTQLAHQSYFSGFDSIGEIDIGDTQAPGFNWYPHNRWPNYALGPPLLATNIRTAPTTPASAIHINSSILTLDLDVSGYGSGLMSCCVDPHDVTKFVGRTFKAPVVFEASMTYDKTNGSIQNVGYSGSSIAWWGTNTTAYNGGSHASELDHMEASTGPSSFKSSAFDSILAPVNTAAEFQNQVGLHPPNTSTFIKVATMILPRSTDSNNLGAKLNFYNGQWAPGSFEPIWLLQTTPPNDFTIFETAAWNLIIGAGSGTIPGPIVVNAPVQFDFVRVFQAFVATPTIVSFAPNVGGVDPTRSLTLVGTAVIGGTVTVFDGASNLGTASVDGGGNWSFTVTGLPNGTHTFTAIATDSTGNTSAASSPFPVTINVLALLTVTINNLSPQFDKRSAEIAFLERALDVIKTELGRGNGNVTSGVILDFSEVPGSSPTPLGTWTYNPFAPNP